MNCNKKEYKYFISGCASHYYPTQLFFGVFQLREDEVLEIPKKRFFVGEWGNPVSNHIMEREFFPMPTQLDIVWLSIVERKFYSLIEELPKDRMETLFFNNLKTPNKSLSEHIVVGMAPYGGVAIWIHGFYKSNLVKWSKAEETFVEMSDFMPLNPDVTLDENCDFCINNNQRVKENLVKNGLPPRDLFDCYMQQFTYRYVVQFGHWDEDKKEWKDYKEDETKPEFDYIEEALYDGTHDKLHDGGLMEYHQAGKPKKLALQYHIKKSQYSTFFWMVDLKIRAAFENFYRLYPEAKMDLIFHIDPEKNIYQISFTCEEAEKPRSLNEEAYQLIVFKSKFERYRSKNYNQPRGAWIW